MWRCDSKLYRSGLHRCSTCRPTEGRSPSRRARDKGAEKGGRHRSWAGLHSIQYRYGTVDLAIRDGNGPTWKNCGVNRYTVHGVYTCTGTRGKVPVQYSYGIKWPPCTRTCNVTMYSPCIYSTCRGILLWLGCSSQLEPHWNNCRTRLLRLNFFFAATRRFS